jgi:mono/diheme cytochrome c family protein
MKKLSIAIVAAVSVASVMSSCTSDPNSPGYEYMPDMYRTPAIEAYSESSFYADSMATRKPVANTIPRGFMPYPYPNTTEGYEAAGTDLKNPLAYNKEILSEGKEIYSKFCIQCHGKDGQGDGSVANNPRWPGPPPPYNGRLKDLSEGKIFHSITYGKGLMGSHAAQISQEDRWKLTYYIQKLQGKDLDALHADKPEGNEEITQPESNEVSSEEMTASM